MVLPIYLWKEWRDHRAVIVAYGVAAPVLLALATVFLGDVAWGASRDRPMIGAFAGFAIAALAFGADLVPGEVRRGRLAFLARMPSDLGSAFIAKLAFFVAMLVSFMAWTYFSASAAGELFGSDPANPPRPWRQFAALAWAALVGASWIFAVSCWVRRGAFALPAAALALAAWLAPVVGAFVMNPEMRLRPGELECAAAWLALSGVGVAALSFLRGWRHGGTLSSHIGWSVGPTLLAFAPVWGWAALRVREYRHLDPGARNFGVYATAVGAGGRYAFVTGYHMLRPSPGPLHRPEYGATHPLIVDLTNGAWREVGSPGDVFWHLGHRWERARAGSVLLVDRRRDPAVPMASQFKEGFDGATGAPLTSEQWKPLLQGARGADRVTSSGTLLAALPDGRLAWGADDRILVRDGDGLIEEMPGVPRARWAAALGLGFGAEPGMGFGVFYDCARGRSFRKAEIGNGGADVKLIRAASWVVSHPSTGRRWVSELWNPESGEFAPIAGWNEGAPIALHPDGRLLVVERARPGEEGGRWEEGVLFLLDPDTGSRRGLPLPPDLVTRIAGGWSYGFTIAGDLIFTLRAPSPERADVPIEWIARLDPRSDGFVCVGPFGSIYPDLLGCPDRDSVVFVSDNRRLLRAHFDGRPAQVLFPR
jgi:hypothetical protein